MRRRDCAFFSSRRGTVSLCCLDIAERIAPVSFPLRSIQFADPPRWNTDDQTAGRDFASRRDDRPRTDYCIGPDPRTIENDGADSDQRSVLDNTAMDGSPVTNGDLVTDLAGETIPGHVHHAVVLEV